MAIVHDKLWQYGGGERVALEMKRIWPGATLYTSTFDPALVNRLGIDEVKATALQRVPLLETTNHYFLPFYDRAFRRLDLAAHDVVVSSSAMFAKSVQPPAGIPHVCYCHTPIRFLWDMRESGIAELDRPAPVRAAVSGLAHWLRRVDRRAAARVDHFIANSSHVAERIKRYYDRDAVVIPPPVDVDAHSMDSPQGDHFVAVARLFPYKRVDLAIEACNRLQLPLKVIGDGEDRARLERLAGRTVEFCGWVGEAEKRRLIASARAMIAPQVEDFGIAMVEAIAAGTPVLAFRGGGSLDILEPGVNGAFIEDQTVEAVTAALRSFGTARYDRGRMRRSVARFAADHFAKRMRDYVEEAVSGAGDAPARTSA